MHSQLLKPFNSFAFNQTTQILLSNFTKEELREILKALIYNKQYVNLSHMVKATLFVSLTHQVDRTYYFLHYSAISLDQFAKQRSNLIASNSSSSTLDNILLNYNSLMQRAQQYFQEDFQLVRSAVFNPDLPLPPTRRSTIAPRCQTVYQIVLACQKVSQFEEQLEESAQQKSEYFYDLLKLQAQMANIQLLSINDSLEHFSEIIMRFMIYRNTVLSLHNISPFPQLTKTMEIWKQIMKPHYLRANSTFAQLSNLKESSICPQYGLITPEILIEEGYLNEYIEGLVDLSIDSELVAFCGHSQQQFGELYTIFQEFILKQQDYIGNPLVEQKLQNWSNYGIKSSTLLKLIQKQCIDSQLRQSKYNQCIKQDNYIETCARIHGFLTNQMQLMQCS